MPVRSVVPPQLTPANVKLVNADVKSISSLVAAKKRAFSSSSVSPRCLGTFIRGNVRDAKPANAKAKER